MTNQQVKPKVLVADDERVIADTLAIILNQSGFEATAVYNGEKAVEAARTLRPDMLISDVIMTDMNGIDAAITIRTMMVDGSTAYLQSGGGLVADSVPANEYQECINKARALVHAIELAERGLE